VLRLFAGAIDGSEEAMNKDAEVPSAGMMSGLAIKVCCIYPGLYIF